MLVGRPVWVRMRRTQSEQSQSIYPTKRTSMKGVATSLMGHKRSSTGCAPQVSNEARSGHCCKIVSQPLLASPLRHAGQVHTFIELVAPGEPSRIVG